jgi:hypothetical protein
MQHFRMSSTINKRNDSADQRPRKVGNSVACHIDRLASATRFFVIGFFGGMVLKWKKVDATSSSGRHR